MSRWFRIYDDAVDDPKVQKLSGDLFKAWINLLCLASQNDGILPSVNDIAFKLRMSGARADKLLDDLVQRELLDETADGHLEPHNWNLRQHRSDISTPRVKRFRERKMKRDETVSETPPDTETDSEQNRAEEKRSLTRSRAVGKPTRPAASKPFDEFWGKYPKREGANPKEPARKKFAAAVKSGADPADIVAAAERYRDEALSTGKLGTSYVAQAVTWLTQARWCDYPPPSEQPIELAAPPGAPSDEELRKRYASRHPQPDSEEILRRGNGVDQAATENRSEGVSAHDQAGTARIRCVA